MNRAGVEVVDTVLEQLAAAEAVLTPDEKELGVALVDIGGGTTDFAIFERGSLWHTGVVAVGGDHFTNDIAVGLRTPVPDAEKIKRRCGCALSSMVDEDETMEVASVGGRKPRVMSRRILSEILQPRAEEIFHLLWDEIRRAGFEKSLQLGHRADRRRRDARGHGGDRRADLRPADPPRRPGRRRRARRPRQQPRLRDGRRARHVRAPEPRRRAARAVGRRWRVLGSVAGTVQGTSFNGRFLTRRCTWTEGRHAHR